LPWAFSRVWRLVVTAPRAETSESEALGAMAGLLVWGALEASAARRVAEVVEEAVASIRRTTAETASDSRPRPAMMGTAEAMTAALATA
jgi:hypothetical protein